MAAPRRRGRVAATAAALFAAAAAAGAWLGPPAPRRLSLAHRAVEEGSVAEFAPPTASKPRQLLDSPEMQHLLSVLGRLKNSEGEVPDEDGLRSFLDRIWVCSAEISGRPIPESLEGDVQEVMQKAEIIMNSASTVAEGGDIEIDEQQVLENFAKLRLARRLPEVSDQLVPWDYVFPDVLEKKSGITRLELKMAMTDAAHVLNLQEVASWSDEEKREAENIIKEDKVMGFVREIVLKNLDEVRETATIVAGSIGLFVLLLPAILAWVLWGLLNNNGGGAEPPVTTSAPLSANELGVLPLYKLGDVVKF